MADIEKAKELLKEAFRNMLDLANGHINYWWRKDRKKGKDLHNKLDGAGKKFDQALSALDEKPVTEKDKKFDEYQDVVHSLLRYLQARGDIKRTGDTCDDIKRKVFALLPPVCETCGGSGKVPNIDSYTKWYIELRKEEKFLGLKPIKRTAEQKHELYEMYVEHNKNEIKPCPTCQQPPASEFVKKARKVISQMWDEKRQKYRNACCEDITHLLIKACSRLDAQQKRIERLVAKDECFVIEAIQALSALDEKPVCKTCKNCKHCIVPNMHCHKWEDACEKVTGLCRKVCGSYEQNLTCQQPPASEFIKEMRFRALRLKSHENGSGWACPACNVMLQYEELKVIEAGRAEDYQHFCPHCNRNLDDLPSPLEDIGIKECLQACDLLDAQQRRIEELEKQNEEIARDNLKLMSSNQQFQAQLAKRDEAIKYLYHCAVSGEDLPLTRKVVNETTRHILGDQFEEIVK